MLLVLLPVLRRGECRPSQKEHRMKTFLRLVLSFIYGLFNLYHENIDSWRLTIAGHGVSSLSPPYLLSWLCPAMGMVMVIRPLNNIHKHYSRSQKGNVQAYQFGWHLVRS